MKMAKKSMKMRKMAMKKSVIAKGKRAKSSVFRGSKVFYVLEPTAAHLAAYERWICDADQDADAPARPGRSPGRSPR